MRRALLLLLFVNLAFLGYAHFAAEPTPAAGSAEPAAPIPRLTLLSELKSPPGPRCLAVGPFAEHSAAEQAAEWLRANHRTTRERSLEADGAPTYWVALKTKTLQQAARVQMRLKAAGVSDLEVTPPGADQTEATVSLGTFGDRDSAERRRSALRGLGVNAAITEQQHKLTQWWLDVAQGAGDPPLDLPALQKAVPGAAASATGTCPDAGTAPASEAPPPATPAAPTVPPSPGPAPAKLPGAPA